MRCPCRCCNIAGVQLVSAQHLSGHRERGDPVGAGEVLLLLLGEVVVLRLGVLGSVQQHQVRRACASTGRDRRR